MSGRAGGPSSFGRESPWFRCSCLQSCRRNDAHLCCAANSFPRSARYLLPPRHARKTAQSIWEVSREPMLSGFLGVMHTTVARACVPFFGASRAAVPYPPLPRAPLLALARTCDAAMVFRVRWLERRLLHDGTPYANLHSFTASRTPLVRGH